MMSMKDEAQILMITGWRNTGKTTFCQFMIEAARERGLKVSGVVSPGVFEDYQKAHIELEDLQSGQRRLLAERGQDLQSEFNTPEWIFNKENLAWGNEIFATAVPTDVLIVDELGPIELEQNKGWVNGIQAVDSGDYQLCVLVIRPELISTAKQRWPKVQTITLQSVNLVPSLSKEIVRDFMPGESLFS
jgi:nucleoside-triphosphatase